MRKKMGYSKTRIHQISGDLGKNPIYPGIQYTENRLCGHVHIQKVNTEN